MEEADCVLREGVVDVCVSMVGGRAGGESGGEEGGWLKEALGGRLSCCLHP